jgi:imidazolonepropionase
MLSAIRIISSLLTLAPAARKAVRYIALDDLGRIEKAAIVWDGERIVWCGEDRKLPKSFSARRMKEQDGRGLTVLPGLVECHTHSVFAGNRSAEFEKRQRGISYAEIAAQGGGILSTMEKTRLASSAELVALARPRMKKFIRQGVTTVEIKSGYALDLKNEMKMLKAARTLDDQLRVVTTYLGPHARPPEFATTSDYLEYCTTEVLPRLLKSKLSTRCDIFVEKGFFEADVARVYLQRARAMGFDVCIHADQLSTAGGAELAIEFGARSADHLLQIKEPQIQKLAASAVTCVFLPTSDLYMKSAFPPARALLDRGAAFALATDFNPGTSPSQDLNLTGLLARLEMKLTLPEVIAGYTVGAARALGLLHEVGSIEIGKSADLFCSHQDWDELFYEVGRDSSVQTFCRGKSIFLHRVD